MVVLRSTKRDAGPLGGDAWVLVEKREGLYYTTGRRSGASINA